MWRDVCAVVKQRQISIWLNKAAVSGPMIFIAPIYWMEENYVRHVRACQDVTWHSWLIIYSWRIWSALIQLGEFLSKPKARFCSQLVSTQLCVYVNQPGVHSVTWDSYSLCVKCFGMLLPLSQLRIWTHSISLGLLRSPEQARSRLMGTLPADQWERAIFICLWKQPKRSQPRSSESLL